MNKGVLKSIFSSGLQAVAVQVLGVLFIAIVAKVLPKDQFGIIQWANVTAMFITTLLSFGMEQVVTRRIASSSSSDWAAAAFLIHNFIGSALAFGLILLIAYLLPDPEGALRYLPLFFAAQGIIFLVMPLKQFLNAKHMFAPYGIISVCSNLCKIGLAVYMIKMHNFTIANTGIVLIVCAGIEFIALIIYVHKKTSFKLQFRYTAYKKLVKESMPQYLAVVFDSSLSRLDMLLLGIIGGSYIAMGEYGFAYRAFEMARLPIVIIAPIILNIFSKMFALNNKMAEEKQQVIKNLYSLEMFFAVSIPLVLNIIWSPALDYFFDGKYGSANATEFLLLSICIPLHFFINLLWTISFANKKYRQIAGLTMFTAVINLVLNLVLIPSYSGLGAAIAFLLTTLFQALAYYMLVTKLLIRLPFVTLLKFLVMAAIIYTITQLMPVRVLIKLPIAVAGYILMGYFMKGISLSQLQNLKSQVKK